MAKSPEAIAAAAVERIQRESFQAGLRQGREEGYLKGWEDCAEKVTGVARVIPPIPRSLTSAKHRTASKDHESAQTPSPYERELRKWIQVGLSQTPDASRSYWELRPDYLDKAMDPIENLDLRVTTYNAFKRMAIHTVGDITQRSLADFFDIKNFGRESFRDLYSAMEKVGYGMVIREE